MTSKKNISDAQQLAETIPQLHLRHWWVNNGPSPEDHNGDFAHFAAEANAWLEQLRQENKRGALILDWDDTIYDEQQRIKRKIKNTYSALH